MEYKFIITALNVQAKKDDVENVVVSVNYIYQSVNDSSVNILGCETFETFDKNNFIEYSDLTENDVISWLEKSIDMVELQKKVDIQLSKKEIVTNYYPFQKAEPVDMQLEEPIVEPNVSTIAEPILPPVAEPIVVPTIDIASFNVSPIELPKIEMDNIEIPKIEIITPIKIDSIVIPEIVMPTFEMPKP